MRILRTFLLSFLLTCAASRTGQSARAESPQPGAFKFALVGDPQIGFGSGGEIGDASRFRQVIDAINHRSIALSLIAGDLVQDRTIWQGWTFKRVLSHLNGRVVLAPGNHDVVDGPSLASYRARHGRDYYDIVYEDCAFVVIDSETARDADLSRAEYEAQWAFLERSLAAHARAGRKHIVLVTHRPPFVAREDEPDDDRNWPTKTRSRLLGLARKSGVRWILAGHLHRRAQAVTHDGIHVLVSAGSAHNFDRSPYGFDLFFVEEKELRHEFVPVGPPIEPRFSVRGLREWTPRMLSFSTRHWLFTVLYAAGGLLVLWAASVRARASTCSGSSGFRAIAFALLAFAANMQLDFDELIREVGRALARILGVYQVRHYITGAMCAVAIALTTWFLWRLYRGKAQPRSLTLAIAFMCVPSAWFGLSSISHHDLGMVLTDDTWDALIVLSVLSTAACAWVGAKGADDVSASPPG